MGVQTFCMVVAREESTRLSCCSAPTWPLTSRPITRKGGPWKSTFFPKARWGGGVVGPSIPMQFRLIDPEGNSFLGVAAPDAGAV